MGSTRRSHVPCFYSHCNKRMCSLEKSGAIVFLVAFIPSVPLPVSSCFSVVKFCRLEILRVVRIVAAGIRPIADENLRWLGILRNMIVRDFSLLVPRWVVAYERRAKCHIHYRYTWKCEACRSDRRSNPTKCMPSRSRRGAVVSIRHHSGHSN
jgi:hypothetical protein